MPTRLLAFTLCIGNVRANSYSSRQFIEIIGISLLIAENVTSNI